MILLACLSYLAGILTLLSPCILPVLPFVFASADQPFRRSGLPLLAGMAITFAGISSLAVAGGAWAVHANEWGRVAALVLLSLFALTLLFPSLAERLSRPFLRLGSALQPGVEGTRGPKQSFILGVATGFLWAPCAGPILGLILTGAALRGTQAGTLTLLLAYAAGAATSLTGALLIGGRFFSWMKRYLGADRWVRRILGVAVLVGVAAIALGWDRGLLTRLSRVRTESLEQKLLERWHPSTSARQSEPSPGVLGGLSGAVAWINSPPLTAEDLRGKVVLVDFWTYSCINCLRSLPFVKAWAEKYKASGLVVIGVHAPEFAFEKNVANVEKAVRDLGLHYPVAVDNQYAIWNTFDNRYWPAHYFIDAAGKVRGHHFGEGNYEESEETIQRLLQESGSTSVPTGLVDVAGHGAQAPSSGNADSPETYLGYDRAENQVLVPSVQRDRGQRYTFPATLRLNQWSLDGVWTVHHEHVVSSEANGKIRFRFRARDLHLVLGPGGSGKSIRFIVRLDGKPPANGRGVDVDAVGNGSISSQRLHQLIRLPSSEMTQDHLFEIEFLDPGCEAFAFTFG